MFLGRLAFRPSPFRVPGRRIVQAFLGRLASGLSPFRALGLGQLARGVGPGPIVPTYLSTRIVTLSNYRLCRLLRLALCNMGKNYSLTRRENFNSQRKYLVFLSFYLYIKIIKLEMERMISKPK